MPHSIRRSPRLSIHPAGPPHLSVNNSPPHHPSFNVTCLSDSHATQARSRIECVTVRLDSSMQIRPRTRRVKSQDPKPTPPARICTTPSRPTVLRVRLQASLLHAARFPESRCLSTSLPSHCRRLAVPLSLEPGRHTVPAIRCPLRQRSIYSNASLHRPITHLYINTGFLASCATTKICRCDGRRHGCPTWKQQVPPSWPGHCRQL